MKTIFITITRGSIIRNYFHTGIIDQLIAAGVRVVALVPFFDNNELLKEFSRENMVYEPLKSPTKIRFESFFIEMFRGLVFNKTVKTYYKYKFLTYEPNYALYYPRAFFYFLVKIIPGMKRLTRFLDNLINPQTENDYLFEKYRPDLFFSTTPHDRADIGVMKSAKRFGVPVVGMPKSWDNLSKTLFPVKLKHMFLWSDYMRNEAFDFQGYLKSETTIVGIPQFDFYTNQSLLVSRDEYFRQHSLVPKKKIILYGSTGAGFEENCYIELIQSFRERGVLKDVQVVMRPHIGYEGEMKKFTLLEKYRGFVVDQTDKQSANLKDRWDVSMNHVKNLFNSMHHADVCMNIASTLTFDASACGTPVVNVSFDCQKTEYKKSLARIYETDYFAAVIKIGATYLARNEKEFSESLVASLADKNSKAEQRKRLIDYFVYRVDGKSSERLVSGILALLS